MQQYTQRIVNTPMARGLDVIGDRWTLLILRDAFVGRCRFEDFRRYIGISKATLSRRLEALISEDVMVKRAYNKAGNRYEYKLTAKGQGMFASSLLAWQWESEWGTASDGSSPAPLPQQLLHRDCGHDLAPLVVCQYCQQGFSIEDVRLPAGDNMVDQLGDMQSVGQQRRVRASSGGGEQDLSLVHISDLIGDRWTLLLLIAAFFGAKRYDSFAKTLNIASNILTARLNLLVDVEVFERSDYQLNPPRSEYLLTTKGRSLYPIVMSLRQWVIDWLPEEEQGAELIHQPCGQPLKVAVHCGHCGEKPNIKSISFVSPQ
ncbi:winged helix-turn-helix transcriptional regulator [Sinobacterium norvegicum]|nr:helix-turn-helix domain-containing protein [Sinobacterium norvegicum]